MTKLRVESQGAGSALETMATALGISDARQVGTDYPGSIRLTIKLPIERTATHQAATGNPLAAWLSEYLAAPEQADVVHKLNASDVAERHAFVIVPGSPALARVVHVLLDDDPPLPDIDPVLPAGLTGVWAASLWSAGRLLHWSAAGGWKSFSTDLPAVERGRLP
jgi:hypothetical protein